jgi:hypothetical protein
MPIDKRRAAADARVRLAAVALYGDPSPSEPLEQAFERAMDRLMMPRDGDAALADRLRARVIAGLPGDSEDDKVGAVLDDAPDWLKQEIDRR